MRCFQCGARNEFEMKETVRKYEGKGYSFELPVTVPYCKKCGAPMADEDLEEEIAKRAHEIIVEQRKSNKSDM